MVLQNESLAKPGANEQSNNSRGMQRRKHTAAGDIIPGKPAHFEHLPAEKLCGRQTGNRRPNPIKREQISRRKTLQHRAEQRILQSNTGRETPATNAGRRRLSVRQLETTRNLNRPCRHVKASFLRKVRPDRRLRRSAGTSSGPGPSRRGHRPALPATEKSALSADSESLAKLRSSIRSIQGAELPAKASTFFPRQRSMDMFSRTIIAFAFAFSIGASTAAAQDTIRWETDLATGRQLAAQTNRLVLVHFWGTWCPPCMEMEKSVFNKPGLGTAVHPYYVPVKIQVEDGMNQDLVKQFQVDGFPCDIVMTAQGQVVSRSKGFKPAGEYVAMLNQAAQQALAAARPIAANAAAPNAPATPVSPYAVPAAAPASPYAMQQTSMTAAPAVATPAAAVPVASTVGSRYSTTYTPPTAAAAQTPPSATPITSAAPAASPARADDRYASYYASRGLAPSAAPATTPSTTATTVATAQTSLRWRHRSQCRRRQAFPPRRWARAIRPRRPETDTQRPESVIATPPRRNCRRRRA